MGSFEAETSLALSEEGLGCNNEKFKMDLSTFFGLSALGFCYFIMKRTNENRLYNCFICKNVKDQFSFQPMKGADSKMRRIRKRKSKHLHSIIETPVQVCKTNSKQSATSIIT